MSTVEARSYPYTIPEEIFGPSRQPSKHLLKAAKKFSRGELPVGFKPFIPVVRRALNRYDRLNSTPPSVVSRTERVAHTLDLVAMGAVILGADFVVEANDARRKAAFESRLVVEAPELFIANPEPNLITRRPRLAIDPRFAAANLLRTPGN